MVKMMGRQLLVEIAHFPSIVCHSYNLGSNYGKEKMVKCQSTGSSCLNKYSYKNTIQREKSMVIAFFEQRSIGKGCTIHCNGRMISVNFSLRYILSRIYA